MHQRAAELRERVEVLRIVQTDHVWSWEVQRTTSAGVELGERTNLFSQVGIGARDASLVLRRQPITLHNALRWRGRHLFLTSLTDGKRGWMSGKAALVELVECQGNVHRGTDGPVFPGVLTEKYLRHERDEPMSVNTLCYVLVTPKAIELTPGGLVDVAAEPYEVLTAHTLDPFKNEYEIVRKRDL